MIKIKKVTIEESESNEPLFVYHKQSDYCFEVHWFSENLKIGISLMENCKIGIFLSPATDKSLQDFVEKFNLDTKKILGKAYQEACYRVFMNLRLAVTEFANVDKELLEAINNDIQNYLQ